MDDAPATLKALKDIDLSREFLQSFLSRELAADLWKHLNGYLLALRATAVGNDKDGHALWLLCFA